MWKNNTDRQNETKLEWLILQPAPEAFFLHDDTVWIIAKVKYNQLRKYN